MALQLNQMKGIDNVLKNLNKEIKGIEGRTRGGLKKAGMILEKASMKRCPVVTSNLKNSHYSESFNTSKGPGCEVGFTASYAPFVHENPRAGKTGGVSPKGVAYKAPAKRTAEGKLYRFKKGKHKGEIRRSTQAVFSTVGGWKFLEIPLKRNARRMLAIIRESAKLKK